MAQTMPNTMKILRAFALEELNEYGYMPEANPKAARDIVEENDMAEVKDHSEHVNRARRHNSPRTAIGWRRREWEPSKTQDVAEAEERRWWATNKPEIRMPEANPKAARAVADGKVPLDYLEPVANEAIAKALMSGADKYGRRNFADPNTTMLMSTYVGAFLRHTTALQRGELTDPDSGLPHLAHIGANVHVVMAAIEAGTMMFDTRDTEVTERSDAVHKSGDQDAKGTAWGVR